MISFLKTVLIILLVYFGAKFLFRLLSPYLMRYVAKKANERFGQAFQQQGTSPTENYKEGEVSIDKMPRSTNQTNKKVGEYVDFEELD